MELGLLISTVLVQRTPAGGFLLHCFPQMQPHWRLLPKFRVHAEALEVSAEELCSFSTVPGMLVQPPALTACSWPSKFGNFKD